MDERIICHVLWEVDLPTLRAHEALQTNFWKKYLCGQSVEKLRNLRMENLMCSELEPSVLRDEIEKEEGRRYEEVVYDFCGSKLRRATVDDYREWLRGYLQRGGRPTHHLNCSMKKDLKNWYVATEDLQLLPTSTELPINIIVPADKKFLGGELSGMNIYFMKGFKNLGGYVPIYRDLKLL
jgi:hypothetical protein